MKFLFCLLFTAIFNTPVRANEYLFLRKSYFFSEIKNLKTIRKNKIIKRYKNHFYKNRAHLLEDLILYEEKLNIISLFEDSLSVLNNQEELSSCSELRGASHEIYNKLISVADLNLSGAAFFAHQGQFKKSCCYEDQDTIFVLTNPEQEVLSKPRYIMMEYLAYLLLKAKRGYLQQKHAQALSYSFKSKKIFEKSHGLIYTNQYQAVYENKFIDLHQINYYYILMQNYLNTVESFLLYYELFEEKPLAGERKFLLQVQESLVQYFIAPFIAFTQEYLQRADSSGRNEILKIKKQYQELLKKVSGFSRTEI